MQPLRNRVLALLVFVPVVALLGCQKGSNSAPPATAVKAGAQSGEGEKAALKDNSPLEEISGCQSDQESQHPTFAIASPPAR